MLNKQLRKQNEKGFTIIEVLIVLAIAALILLIVFLAVPALQRSARNNSRKNDASRVSTAVANWNSNNNGSLPGNETGSFVLATFKTDCGSIASDIGTLSEYGSGSPSLGTATTGWCGSATTTPTAGQFGATSGAVTISTAPTGDLLFLDDGAVCPTSTSLPFKTTAGNSRQAALIYTTETSSTSAYGLACVQST